jgi:hypothetical protein
VILVFAYAMPLRAAFAFVESSNSGVCTDIATGSGGGGGGGGGSGLSGLLMLASLLKC